MKEVTAIIDFFMNEDNMQYLLKGNEPDFDRTCFSVIDDFRKGKLGKITLDKVSV